MKNSPLKKVKEMLQAVLDRSRESLAAGKGIPHEAFWAQVETRAPLSAAEKKAEKI